VTPNKTAKEAIESVAPQLNDLMGS
jgi:hypothetical protein